MYPEYVKVEDKKYKINTNFKVAIECNRIAQDETIGDMERGLAIIYTLFGEEGINTPEHYEKLLELAKKYLLCGKEAEDTQDKEPDMDFVKDMDYIEASFMSDFHIDLENTQMHWWKFMKLMNGLSNSEFGNCCVLNNIRNLRNLDLNTIQDSKTREQLRKAKEQVSLHKEKTDEDFTDEELANMDAFDETGL
jgi:hypothetical protein